LTILNNIVVVFLTLVWQIP